jgi:hypothetical protein
MVNQTDSEMKVTVLSLHKALGALEAKRVEAAKQRNDQLVGSIVKAKSLINARMSLALSILQERESLRTGRGFPSPLPTNRKVSVDEALDSFVADQTTVSEEKPEAAANKQQAANDAKKKEGEAKPAAAPEKESPIAEALSEITSMFPAA